jgi:hypothetical protein
MAIFAVLNNNNVTNTIVADSLEIAEQATNSTCIELLDGMSASAGSIWDGVNFVDPIVI